MRVAICAATENEILPTLRYLSRQKTSTYEKSILLGSVEILVLTTGIGAVATSAKCMQLFLTTKIDLIINAGIAGSFKPEFKPGDTCVVYRDRFGDLGTSHADGTFSDIYDMGLEDADMFPFKEGWLVPERPGMILRQWPSVSGITVNKVTGHTGAIEEISGKYRADLESMEGAGFFYASMLAGIDALQLRTVSNFVTPRDKSSWNIPLAIQNLNENLIQIIDELAR